MFEAISNEKFIAMASVFAVTLLATAWVMRSNDHPAAGDYDDED